MNRFVWPTRVYWEDTDGGGVVYYANYLRFMERARSEWLRAHGFAQSALAADPGVLFSVIEAHIKYLKPARLDDLLYVTCVPAIDGAASLKFTQQIRRATEQGVLLAEGMARVACVSAVGFKARRLPAALLKELQ